jgi:ligand-binding sensor domain-containing protein
MKPFFKYIFCICFVLPYWHAAAQQYSFRSYTSGEGLSQNSGYCIAQDGQGFLWMGTQDGLNRFDGKTIKTYYKEVADRGKLPDNHIRSLFYDSTHNWLWIGTVSGLCIYNCFTDSFYSVSNYFPKETLLNGLWAKSIIRGRHKNEVVIVTTSEGIILLDTKTFTGKNFFSDQLVKVRANTACVFNQQIFAVVDKQLFRITNDKTDVVIASSLLNDIRKIFVWSNALWFASTVYGALYIDDIANPAVKTFNCGSTDVGTFETDTKNNLWIGTRTAGIVIISPNSLTTIASFENAANQNDWPKKFTLSLLKDRQGNMWAGSSGGGFAMHTAKNNSFNLIRKTQETYGKSAHNMILSLLKTDANTIYTGTQLEGLRKYNNETGNIETVFTSKESLANSVYKVVSSSPTDLWLATSFGLVGYNTVTKKTIYYRDTAYAASTAGQFLYKLKDKNTLFYSSNKGALFFNIDKKQFRQAVKKYKNDSQMNLVINDAWQDNNHNLWLASSGYGLVKINLDNELAEEDTTIGKYSKNIYTLYNNNDTLWLGTSSGVIIYLPYKNELLKTITVANGLPGNVIYSIEKGLDKNFWCGSNKGLIKINPYTSDVMQINTSAGLQADEFNTACSEVDTTTGLLYFGGINGVSYFNPTKILTDTFSPQPVILGFKIFNQPANLPQNIANTYTISLNHNQNFISINYGSLNFINHDGVIYSYFCNGVDPEWVQAGSRDYVNYSSLSPGKYTFFVKCANSNGIWSSEKVLEIIIKPAFWQTWWFKAMCVFCLLAGVYYLVATRVAYIRKKASLKQQITETEIAALKAQMNPHFMFNCINSIDAFIQNNDKYNATLYLNKFAKLIRNVLDSSKQNVVPFSKDIDTLKLYIELEELRHKNKFTTQLEIDPELLYRDYRVPPLIIQPFVENAILHGLKNKPGNNGILNITIKDINDTIQYCITDNGIGRKAASQIVQTKEASYGIQMSFERVKLFNKEMEPSVRITDLYNNVDATGTSVIISLKIM